MICNATAVKTLILILVDQSKLSHQIMQVHSNIFLENIKTKCGKNVLRESPQNSGTFERDVVAPDQECLLIH